jgi:hypothetical protein
MLRLTVARPTRIRLHFVVSADSALDTLTGARQTCA